MLIVFFTRFGLPQGFIPMMSAVMRDRRFFVTDSGETSPLQPKLGNFPRLHLKSPYSCDSYVCFDAPCALKGSFPEQPEHRNTKFLAVFAHNANSRW